MKTNPLNYLTAISALLLLQGCAPNHFKKTFKSQHNFVTRSYGDNLVDKNNNPVIYTTDNPEVDMISLLENGYISLGESEFTSVEINSKSAAIKFAKEIGASVVLLNSKFLHTKTTTTMTPLSASYPISQTPNTVTLNNYSNYSGSPGIGYNISYDTKDKKIRETITTVTPSAALYSQNSYIDGESNTRKTELINQHIWSSHNPNTINSTPDIALTVRVPTSTESEEAQIHSYHATFWAKTTRKPALGIDVIDLSDEIKKKLDLNGGVLVRAVIKNSPALMAPIYRGDILLSINDNIIFTESYIGDILRKNVGKVVKLELFRDGEKIIKEVKLNNSAF